MKEEEKVNKYRDLGKEIKALWHMKGVTTTPPVVIGALGMFTDRLKKYLEDIQMVLKAHTMQKSVLLTSARILRRLRQSFRDDLHPNSPKPSLRFATAYEASEKMFYFLNKKNIINDRIN